MSLHKCWNTFTQIMDLESARHAWLKLAKTLLATNNRWPASASIPQTGFCIGLRSKSHPGMHQPQPFQTPNPLALHAVLVLGWWMWSTHCMIQTSPQCGACHGLIPINSNHSIYHQCRSQRLAISASHCSDIACLKHLKPGHRGTCCLQSHAPGPLALGHRCRAAAAGLRPCWFATPKPKPGQHGW